MLTDPETTNTASRRALLATGTAVVGSVATAGCVDRVLPGDDSPEERTIGNLGIGNRQDRPIEVSVLMRLDGELEFWETVELTTSEAGRDHIIDGPWHAAPGELEVLARYRPMEAAEDVSSPQVWEYTLTDDDYEGCIVLTTMVTSEWGIEVREIPGLKDASQPCPPVEEW